MAERFRPRICCLQITGDFMGETYCVKESRLIKLNKTYYKKYLGIKLLRLIMGGIGIGLVIIGSGLITWYIYQNCVEPIVQDDGTLSISLISRITTGSLFATFGSAIIAVFTLYTGRYITRFQENSAILTQQLAGEGPNGTAPRRWPFIPRVSRTRFANETHFFGIESVYIQFQIESFSHSFPLPTTEIDFKELPIFLSYLLMKLLRKRYLTRLKSPEHLAEYPMWDCVMAIYRSILLYKASCFCVWIGVCFVLQSIVFTFFYPCFFNFSLPAI